MVLVVVDPDLDRQYICSHDDDQYLDRWPRSCRLDNIWVGKDISDGSGPRFFGLGRARAFRFRARARVGLRPDNEGFFGRARALNFRARVGLGPG